MSARVEGMIVKSMYCGSLGSEYRQESIKTTGAKSWGCSLKARALFLAQIVVSAVAIPFAILGTLGAIAGYGLSRLGIGNINKEDVGWCALGIGLHFGNIFGNLYSFFSPMSLGHKYFNDTYQLVTALKKHIAELQAQP